MGSIIAWFILGKLLIAVVSAKLLVLVAGLLQLLFVAFCGFWLFDSLFCVLGIELFVDLLDAKSLSLIDFLMLVGIMFFLFS
jgi:hypothetical protein